MVQKYPTYSLDICPNLCSFFGPFPKVKPKFQPIRFKIQQPDFDQSSRCYRKRCVETGYIMLYFLRVQSPRSIQLQCMGGLVYHMGVLILEKRESEIKIIVNFHQRILSVTSLFQFDKAHSKRLKLKLRIFDGN